MRTPPDLLGWLRGRLQRPAHAGLIGPKIIDEKLSTKNHRAENIDLHIVELHILEQDAIGPPATPRRTSPRRSGPIVK